MDTENYDTGAQMMDITDAVVKLDPNQAKSILKSLLNGYLTPAFGALPKREIDLLFLDQLEEIGILDKDSSIYDLVQNLRVTRTKARNLLYDRALRRLDIGTLDQSVKKALQSPLIQKQGDLYALEIENPLVADHLRSKLQSLGHTSDGSFSSSLVRLTRDAVAALIEFYLNKKQRIEVKKALVDAGFPDGSVKGVINSALKTLGKKVAGEAGDAIAESVGGYMTPLLDGVATKVKTTFSALNTKEQHS